MSLRSNGSYIGPRPAGPSLSAASGIWDLRTAERQQRAAAWPMVQVPMPTISGLLLHLDASDAETLYDATTGGSLVAADGGVARWEDKSGNNRHATQSSSGLRPLRKAATITGKGVLRFDGSDDLMSLPTNFRWWPTGTFFAVLSRSNDASQPWYAAKQSSDNPELRLFPQTHSGRWYYSGGYKLVDAAGHYTAIPSEGSATIRAVVLDDTSYKSYSDGVLQNSTTLSSSVSSNDPGSNHSIGGYVTGKVGIDIGELIMYDSALSDSNRAAVEAYLASKWGIS
jgi:hypothetical protein